jgi:hypothetical protein
VLFTYKDYQIKGGGLGGTCDKNGKKDKHIHGFGEKTKTKQTTLGDLFVDGMIILNDLK